MTTSRNVATKHHNQHDTSIFRRVASTEVFVVAAGNKATAAVTEETTINRQSSNQSSDTGTAFFVVDMDMTSQGEIMCEEVSHLSDPTSYMLTTPIHTRAPPSRGRSPLPLLFGTTTLDKRNSTNNNLTRNNNHPRRHPPIPNDERKVE
jgi:hypothetical protein